jgi:hypothetical protein
LVILAARVEKEAPMWLVGQVIDVQRGFEGDRKADSEDLTTIYVEADQDITAIVCYTDHLPADLLEQFVRVNAEIYCVQATQEDQIRLDLVYRSANYQGAIYVLRPSVVRTLRLR